MPRSSDCDLVLARYTEAREELGRLRAFHATSHAREYLTAVESGASNTAARDLARARVASTQAELHDAEAAVDVTRAALDVALAAMHGD